jgi:hypothetical protein
MASYTLNDARLDAHRHLAVKAKVFDPTPTDQHLHGGEEFRLRIRIRNTFEEGHGGGGYGDANFKNIVVRVWGSDFTQLLSARGGTMVDGNKKNFRPSLGPDNKLTEGERTQVVVWFRAVAEIPHDETVKELIAKVVVTADFDIDRYFRIRKVRKPRYDIDIHAVEAA